MRRYLLVLIVLFAMVDLALGAVGDASVSDGSSAKRRKAIRLVQPTRPSIPRAIWLLRWMALGLQRLPLRQISTPRTWSSPTSISTSLRRTRWGMPLKAVKAMRFRRPTRALPPAIPYRVGILPRAVMQSLTATPSRAVIPRRSL